MKLIDRYVYAVTEHLQKDIREDVGKELRTNIEDMLPENYTEKDVYQVLEELGSPWKLANEYNPSKKYLIGPGYYDNYLSVLKLVIGICTSVLVGIAMLSWAIEPPVDGYTYSNLLILFTKLIATAFEGAIQGALWVTLVFVILERTGVETGQVPFSNKKWTPDDLPEYPINDKKKISRGETVFSMLCTILFISLIYIKPQLISLYTKDDNGVLNATPFFNIDRLQKYMMIFFVFLIIQLAIFVWKYITGSWNLSLAIVNAIYNVAFSILIIVLLSDQAILNTEFFSKILESTNGSSIAISTWMDISKWIFVAVFVVISCLDSISGIVKSLSRTSN
jgi:hypothetical protein